MFGIFKRRGRKPNPNPHAHPLWNAAWDQSLLDPKFEPLFRITCDECHRDHLMSMKDAHFDIDLILKHPCATYGRMVEKELTARSLRILASSEIEIRLTVPDSPAQIVDP